MKKGNYLYRNIQVLNGRLGSCFLDDDFTIVFSPYKEDTIKDLINDLKIEIDAFSINELGGPIVITESLATYIIDNVDPTFFDNLSCFNIVEDVDITHANTINEEPYRTLLYKCASYEFKPKPRKIRVNWSSS